MAGGQLGLVLQHLRRLVGSGPAPEGTDGQLLAQFVRDRDQAAFAVLAQRHGPLVLGVCRRVLRDAHAIEDAFQATFLILARKAASIARQESVGSWLHGVAYRVAVRARISAVRRQALEKLEADMTQTEPLSEMADPAETADWHEVAGILDEELQRLPEKHRTLLVLCYLRGQTNEQAAQELRCPTGSMSWRLNEARERLRERLTRRGVALSAAALASGLAVNTAPAAVPATLLDGALRAVALGTASGQVSTAVVELTEGILHTMGVSKMKIAVALVLSLAVLGTGLGVWSYSSAAKDGGPNKPATEAKVEPRSGPPVKGLTLTLSADKTETVMKPDGSNAEPVKLTATFTNVGEKPIKLDTYLIQYGKLQKLAITGPDATSADVFIRADKDSPPPPAAKDYIAIPPGKSWSISYSFPLNFGREEWTLKKPGTYRLKLTYDTEDPYIRRQDNNLAAGIWTGEVISNEVELKVKPAEFGQAVKGLKLSLTADKLETKMKADGSNAEPVKLSLAFSNVSDQPIKLNAYDLGWRHLRLQVTGPDAQSFQVTSRVVERKLVPPEPKHYPEIEPRGSWTTGIQEFPGRRYDMGPDLRGTDLEFTLLKPGTYRLKIAYTSEAEGKGLAAGCWSGDVTSNEVELKVKPADKADGFGPPVRGLAARVTLPKEKFTVGDAIPVTYVIKNVSKEDGTTWHSGFWPNHMIVVTDVNGKEPPLTDEGQKVRQAFNPEGPREKNAPFQLKPGAEDGAWPKYDIAKLYDLSKPGHYSVQYIYQEGGPMNRVTSNLARFEIVAR